jgi:hypothetical protein
MFRSSKLSKRLKISAKLSCREVLGGFVFSIFLQPGIEARVEYLVSLLMVEMEQNVFGDVKLAPDGVDIGHLPYLRVPRVKLVREILWLAREQLG